MDLIYKLVRFHLPRLNPLGLDLAAPALFEHGTHEQRLRFLPETVSNAEVWCRLYAAAMPAEVRGMLRQHRPAEGTRPVGGSPLARRPARLTRR
ncbi:hypothetical protein BJF79_09155 [Actinomadura sp. CNU-125]|uniref:hypothetical protein n=1 Tax=Actinomadura sp. CNU-125 TaxID=1904961 RepID=UPI00096065DB|nr:hypothetical protein [Actinomadura sp. CNU-125]OLT31149.1 hypothetical protein BJF79_09155 [Actinomadura sp. CNU-125]